tara:strand:- start:793 stop:1602 length:810 start_codon:yes stop_codon:yes gene_type:complete
MKKLLLLLIIPLLSVGQNDTIKEYFENGKLSIFYICDFNELGEYDGLYKSWYPDGDIREEGNYTNGVKNGCWKYYSSSSDKRYREPTGKTEGCYKNGLPEGVWKEWYWQNSQLESEKNYKNGVLDGVITFWYLDGTMKKKHHFKNGKKHGLSESFWENGELYYALHYVHGEPEGECKEYDKNGMLRLSETYVNGKKEGLLTINYSSGELWNNIYFKNGEKHGSYKVWYKNGQEKFIGMYTDGELKSEKCWDSFGNKSSCDSVFWGDRPK